MLRRSIEIIIGSSILCFICDQSMANPSGYKMSMWEAVDIQMVDLINDGYSLVSQHHQSDREKDIKYYYLQKSQSLFECTVITFYGDPKKKGDFSIFTCERLVAPHPYDKDGSR